ncbi:MAG: hypothetical protein J6Z49_04020 [Kiritimatiellae bacterium]|nr:hypothetical protein [Kiritimatiellia bacterium]
METVILSVLIATAVLVAVVAIGRLLVRHSDLMGKGVTGQGNLAAKAVSCPQEGYQKQASDDFEQAKKFSDEFSDMNAAAPKR